MGLNRREKRRGKKDRRGRRRKRRKRQVISGKKGKGFFVRKQK